MNDDMTGRFRRRSLIERGRALAIAATLALALGLGAGAMTGAGLASVDVAAQAAAQSRANAAVVAEAANPAVVTVTTLRELSPAANELDGIQRVLPGSQQEPDGNGQLVPLGTGSGFIIDEAGHVVTNSHVVAGGSAYGVTYFDGRSVMATLVGNDPFQDVAVLKIDLAAGESVPGTVSFGDSDLVEAGDPVVSIGTPYGQYANTVTTGIVNATGRGLDSGGGYSLPHLLQHDADIYPGNSGGPLLNADGEVIGINVAKAFTGQMGMDAEGFNFAIESNAARQIVDEIIADGSYERSYLGIRGQATWDGVEIVSVETDGPAAAAGLREGDVIVGIEGIGGDDLNEALDVVLFEKRPGDVVTLEVLRDGEIVTLEITLGERPETMTS